MNETEHPRKLPRSIAVRLADLRRHYGALLHAMGAFGEDFAPEELAAAARSDDPDELARLYSVERPFELLDNYVVELAAAGLVAAGTLAPGEEPSSGIEALRKLHDEGVISRQRCKRLEQIHRARSALQHRYPDMQTHALHEAVHAIAAELPGFLADYARWLRELGFGEMGSPKQLRPS